mmetsp:Transcript_38223/g.113291  ORF Transcript_38223/g.113291 Transcript_38223/m.113291 type:complete len:211 (-) Transcript_38223:108-740(-)
MRSAYRVRPWYHVTRDGHVREVFRHPDERVKPRPQLVTISYKRAVAPPLRVWTRAPHSVQLIPHSPQDHHCLCSTCFTCRMTRTRRSSKRHSAPSATFSDSRALSRHPASDAIAAAAVAPPPSAPAVTSLRATDPLPASVVPRVPPLAASSARASFRAALRVSLVCFSAAAAASAWAASARADASSPLRSTSCLRNTCNSSLSSSASRTA